MGLIILSRISFLIALMLFADIWSIRGLRFIFGRRNRLSSIIILSGTLLFFAITLIVFLKHGMPGLDPVKLRGFYIVTTAFIFIYIPKLVLASLVFVEDLLILVYKGLRNIFPSRPRFTISRKRKRKKSFFVWPGLILSLAIIILLIDGTFFRKHNWVVREVNVPIQELPESFDGYRIVQFSDAHVGSFFREKPLIKGLMKIRETNPDLVLFTGDVINSNYTETYPYSYLFRQILSKDGKFAVLGNHDMDDFMRWTDDTALVTNIKGLEKFWHDAGFKLLRNHYKTIVKGGDTLVLSGVDNWGLPPFKKYGDLNKALSFKGKHQVILMSHDPSHWRAEVQSHPQVVLTLSGHTHAMQFGIKTEHFSWSPSSWIYPEWNGLYQSKGQYMYVNPGFGYLGYLGRVGLRPEITVLVLRRAS